MSITPMERLAVDLAITAAHAVEHKRWSELRMIGVTPVNAEKLCNLTMRQIFRLAQSRRLMNDMRINPAALGSLIDVAEKEQRSDTVVRALVRLDAPLPMMSALFGFTCKDYADVRRSLGKKATPGRPRALTDAEEINAWQAWEDSVTEPTLADRYLGVARATGTPLGPLWGVLKHWTIDAGIPIVGDDRAAA